MAGDVAMRDRVLAAVQQFPGIHLRGLMKVLDTSTALARYHVQALIDAGTVRSYDVGGFVRYFPAKQATDLSKADRQTLGVLRQEKPLEIVLALLEHGPMQHRDLHALIGGSKGTLTYHLEKMIEHGLVRKVPKGPDRGFHLMDPEGVRSLLARFEPVPHLLEQVHDMWDDLFSGHRSR